MTKPSLSSDLILKAVTCACRTHDGQRRKDGTPYAAHPLRVCLTLGVVFGIEDEASLCAAILHDVIEHGGVSFDELLADFGAEVAELVAGMSKDFRLPEEAREAEFEGRLAEGSWKLRAIKLADAHDNLRDGKVGARRKAERVLACVEGDHRLRRAVGALRNLLALGNSGK